MGGLSEDGIEEERMVHISLSTPSAAHLDPCTSTLSGGWAHQVLVDLRHMHHHTYYEGNVTRGDWRIHALPVPGTAQNVGSAWRPPKR